MRRYRFPMQAGIIVLLLAGSASVQGEDWPDWRGPRRDGTWSAPPIRHPFFPPDQGIVWRKSVGPGYAGISVVGNNLYVMDRIPKAGPEPDGQERLLCLSTLTGKTLWSHTHDAHYGSLDYASGPRASPAVVNGIVYTLGAVGTACALDASTGRVIWQRDFRQQEGAIIPTWGLAATPLLIQQQVILHVGIPKGSIVSLDARTGKENWRSIHEPAGYATPILIKAPFGSQLIVWTPEQVHGIDPDGGQIDWSIPYKVTYGVSIATPIYHEGIVFVSGYWEGSKAIEIGPARNQAKILYEENRWLRGLMAPPLQAAGDTFLLDKKHGLTCFDIRTGKKKWDDDHTMTPAGTNPQASFVWTGRGREVLAFNADGDLIRAEWNEEGCHELDRVHLIEPAPPSQTLWAHPAFAGDSIYVRSDREILRYRLTPEKRDP
ncbi:PQQ-like beta-propeller repeat protein [bacterium]|nr:PQQ-like beta-propeller repeat protein [bacterium]